MCIEKRGKVRAHVVPPSGGSPKVVTGSLRSLPPEGGICNLIGKKPRSRPVLRASLATEGKLRAGYCSPVAPQLRLAHTRIPLSPVSSWVPFVTFLAASRSPGLVPGSFRIPSYTRSPPLFSEPGWRQGLSMAQNLPPSGLRGGYALSVASHPNDPRGKPGGFSPQR